METDDGLRTMMTEPFTLGNLQDREQFDFTDGSYLSADEFGLEHPDTILLQYTGLKDKNGKEIYEGNVVQDERGRRYEVFAVPGGFAINAFGGGNDNNFWDGLSSMQTGGWITQTEIIGNIYEQPELVK
jgi:uncharacterized phage protein (TIGR01671 family)